MMRAGAESDAFDRVPGLSGLFRDRGLSSDTSIFPNFAIDQALEAITSKGVVGDRVRRVAIVGPGLDVVDKGNGFDFYPVQTIQPFAVIDSLVRLGLAADDLQVTTFDLSPGINQHLEAARQRARMGGPYVLQLPRDRDERWNPRLLRYWERFGGRIGEEVKAIEAPSATRNIQVRAVRVRPAVVMSVIPQDVNIVLQRLETQAADEQFDLMIVTNILVYYDVFEQSLALLNVAKMLRPGGLFLSNDPLVDLPTTPISRVGYSDVVYGEGQNGSRLTWYQRQ